MHAKNCEEYVLKSTRLLKATSAAALLSFALVACGGSESDDAAASISANAPATPVFEAKEVDVKTVDVSRSPEHDDGLNTTVRLQSANYNNQGGGSVIYVLLTNDNDAPLPADAFSDPTLTVNGESIDRVENGTVDLELPLEAHASTNLAYAFDVNFGNLSDAEFQIGNLKFKGNFTNI
ncbi:hypothetical protein CPELA_03010 [Corynebacterium pelargi]|uniref:Telomeric repeat-binding factor 2 n=1 Tax=Corynebacterium pelargi TaxID=1471400 RepID=A0A410W7D9_9CORY|nr:hypothetical protein CPELA_03010 [Corynebacterium pelargi]